MEKLMLPPKKPSPMSTWVLRTAVAVALILVAATSVAWVAFHMKSPKAESQKNETAASTSDSALLKQLMVKQVLPDIVQGSADAPITMIEYASMTCSHCAAFDTMTYPTLLKKYVDAGKVRFILREFPLDPLATVAFMLARCSGPQKRTAVVNLLFEQQKNWAFTDKPLEGLSNLLKQTGMSQASFESCINDKSLYDKVMQERNYASEKFGIEATPTFFINGKMVNGEITPEALDKVLEPMLKG